MGNMFLLAKDRDVLVRQLVSQYFQFRITVWTAWSYLVLRVHRRIGIHLRCRIEGNHNL